jgi:hypothetical protein
LLAIGIDHHRLRAPVEQRFADEILKRLDPAAERRGDRANSLAAALASQAWLRVKSFE